SLLCARGFLSANAARGLNGTSALTAAASATNAAEAEKITQDLAHGPRALLQSQTKGLCLGSSPLSLSLHRRICLRPLTVKLRGRTTTPDERRGRTLSPGARGAKPTTPHGPLQRLLGGNLLERELWSASANRGVFNRDRADIALGVEVEHGVLVQIARVGYRSVPELNQQRVRVFEVPNLHGTK